MRCCPRSIEAIGAKLAFRMIDSVAQVEEHFDSIQEKFIHR
jgi:hypothetical protein